jgi:GTPase KRas protein
MSSVSKEFRLVVVGPPVVGKSALTIRLTQSEFANEYDPTIEDSYRYYTTIDNTPASLDILDTAGQEEYSSMRDLYMKTGEGFLLVFSLTDRQTFEEISTFYNQIMRVKGETAHFVPMMLVGNKNDLTNERQVSPEEAIHMAKKLNCAYIETSAKTGLHVNDAFHGLVKMVMYGDVAGVGLENTLYPNKEEEKLALKKRQEAQVQAQAQAEKDLQAHTNANAKQQQSNAAQAHTSGSGNHNKNSVISNANINAHSNQDAEPAGASRVSHSKPAPPSAGAKESGGGCCVIM